MLSLIEKVKNRSGGYPKFLLSSIAGFD